MGMSMEMTKQFFDTKGLHYDERKDGKAIRVSLGGMKNREGIRVSIIFDDNDKTVALRTYDLCKVPEDKLDRMYEACSELNRSFRWLKFYVDASDNTVTAEDDAIVTPESAGEEIFGILARMVGIVDRAHPELMKALWG